MKLLNRKNKDLILYSIRVVMGRKSFELLRAYLNLGYWPNIKNPKTFNEKMIYIKLYKDLDFIVDLVDKYNVRSFVKSKVGAGVLNKLYYVGTDFSEVDWGNLPEKFVVKATQSGGENGNILVRDKSKEKFEDIIKKSNTNLKSKFGFLTSEYFHLKIKPRLIVEEFLENPEGNVPTDYKFFCFHGKCSFIQVNSGRYTQHYRSFFDTDWKAMDFDMGSIPSCEEEKPKNLDAMLEVAEKLSKDFDFVRIDLYDMIDSIRFGEMTFIPNAGYEPFNPQEKDEYYGSLI